MEHTGYRIVYEGGTGEIEEKKSRFIATVRPVTSEEEALRFISAMKKQYWDARHNCHAFVIGKNNELQRCSDDGEPNGTAGRPMLDVLMREELHNVVVVVTRYFGGTLLGTGGLVRAYQKSVQAGLADCTIVERCVGAKLEITTDYNGVGKIQYQLAENHIETIDTVYAADVVLIVMVPDEKKESLVKKITEATAGKAGLSWGDEVEYAFVDKELKIF